MNYKTIFKSLFLTVLFAVGVNSVSLAQQTKQPPKRPQMNHWRQHNRMWRHKHRPMIPDLSDTLKKQIKNIMLNTRETVLPVQNKLREARAHLRTLATADNADMQAINQTIENIGNLKVQIAKQRLAAYENIRKLLNEKQRVIFDTRIGMFLAHKTGHRMRGAWSRHAWPGMRNRK